MSDETITIFDATEPQELASEIHAFVGGYAKRTGNYEMAGTFSAAADWLVRLAEENEAKDQRIAELTKAAQAVWSHVDNIYEPPDDPELYVLAKKLREIASE